MAAAIQAAHSVHRVYGPWKQAHFLGKHAGGEVLSRGGLQLGQVAGKAQTHLLWDSWQKPYVDREPAVWFHEVFRTDGSAYKQDEVNFIRNITGRKTAQ